MPARAWLFPVAAVLSIVAVGNAREARTGALTDVPGIRVGHHTLSERPTGCTVVIADPPAVGGVDVRGGAPGTRETDLLDPVNTVERVNAIVLSGGSAFGLDTASGAVKWLDEHGAGFETTVARVPIVPAAILFDLGLGDPHIRPSADCGYRAAAAAQSGPVAEGSVGAGAGATVGKLMGLPRAMKSGIGTASLSTSSGLIVGALAAVNSFGDVDRSGDRARRRRRAHCRRTWTRRCPPGAAREQRNRGSIWREHDAGRRRDQRNADQSAGDEGRPDGAGRSGSRHCPGSYTV